MDQEIKVMLVDDHTLFRKGLAELLDGRDGIRVGVFICDAFGPGLVPAI